MQGSNAHCPQHCSQVGSVYEVQLPTDVQKLLIRMATIATLGLSLGLRVTPLACVGLNGFVAELIFWMVIPVVFVMIILVATWARVVIHGRSRASRSAMGARASRTSAGASAASTATIWLFVLCGWYKFGALTQLEKVQGVMSPELKQDYLASYVSLSGILWLASLGAFLVLGLVVGKLARDEAKRRRREAKSAVARRLRYLNSHEEVLIEDVLEPLPQLEELQRRLYVSLTTTPMSHLPHAGPFHIFLRFGPHALHSN